MTAAASLGNVSAVDRRLWIVWRQHRRHVPILCMAIETRGGLHAIANCLRVEAVVVASVGGGVKKRTGQIRKLFSRTVATLTLKRGRRNRRRTRVWTTDNCSIVRLYWSLRNILIRLRANPI